MFQTAGTAHPSRVPDVLSGVCAVLLSVCTYLVHFYWTAYSLFLFFFILIILSCLVDFFVKTTSWFSGPPLSLLRMHHYLFLSPYQQDRNKNTSLNIFFLPLNNVKIFFISPKLVFLQTCLRTKILIWMALFFITWIVIYDRIFTWKVY